MITKMALDDDDNDLTMWKQTLQVNLHAPLLLSKLAKDRMTNGGVIINVSSIHGELSNEYMGAYAASKAGLESLTRSLALEWADDDIRVNAVAPGVVPVERTAKAFDDPAVTNGWLKHMPAKALGTVEQVADAVVPLITNTWVTGTSWTVDGGMSARCNMPKRGKPDKPSSISPVETKVSIEE
jgi:glucose 1-dehydrogenase